MNKINYKKPKLCIDADNVMDISNFTDDFGGQRRHAAGKIFV